MKFAALILLATAAVNCTLFRAAEDEDYSQAEPIQALRELAHHARLPTKQRNHEFKGDLPHELHALIKRRRVFTSFAVPANTRGAKWGTCGPTAPFDDYDRIVVGVPSRFSLRTNNNPNDDIVCKRPFYVEIYNPKNGRRIVAKIAGVSDDPSLDKIGLSEKAYALIGGDYGTNDRTLVKWRFVIR